MFEVILLFLVMFLIAACAFLPLLQHATFFQIRRRQIRIGVRFKAENP
jgi:hypothetical protein